MVGPLGLGGGGKSVAPVAGKFNGKDRFRQPGFGAVALRNRLPARLRDSSLLIVPRFMPLPASYRDKNDTEWDDVLCSG